MKFATVSVAVTTRAFVRLGPDFPQVPGAPITSIEDAVSALGETQENLENQIEDTRRSYAAKRTTLKKLEQQVADHDEKLSTAELGVYEPHFDFEYSDE
ncbi:hypothetical protein [Roseisalinus antarcticus]|uniref:hypothetical protein n=1 Tax=Roseisalinus antarcticus TaxID=254357 RepID=UPI001F383182|nr:hypothetical protein [Roseisalinus antarcticus]